MSLWLAPVLLTILSPTVFSNADDSAQPYALYLPDDFNPASKYPLVISLHSEDNGYRMNLRTLFGKLPAEPFPNVQYIVASPLARGVMGYQGLAEKDVYDVLADVKKRYPIDDDRVYLTGISMGGGGALWLGLTRPDVWAAIAPLCPRAPEAARPFAPNALNLPVHLFQGSGDPIVPAAVSRRWQHDLLEGGSPVEYSEYPNLRHNAWDAAYRDAAIFDWFGRFKRNRFPDRVHFVTDCYRYSSAYWVQIDGLTPGTPASIDAAFKGAGQLAITTANLDGFTLNLIEHPKYTRQLSITIDGVKVTGRQALSFKKGPSGWRPGRYVAVGKRPGLEGPVAAAVAGRQIYVFGAGGPDAARQAADWSSLHSQLKISFRVEPDGQVTAADRKNANLILFGNRDTNQEIARLKAPLALNVSAADYGLVFVYPAGDRYVLVNSGLPWWTGAEFVSGGLPFVPEKLRVLLGLEDYVLFKGTFDNVVAAGRFERDWTLSKTAAEKLRSTGAVDTAN
jgi:hypothetical protein